MLNRKNIALVTSGGSNPYGCQLQPNSGSGSFSCTITVPTTQVSESFYGRMQAIDVANNVSGYVLSSNQVVVTNTSGDDTAPSISNVTLSTTSIDVSSNAQSVTISGTITDADTWVDIGSTDLPIFIDFSAGTSGVGNVTVEYIQGINNA